MYSSDRFPLLSSSFLFTFLLINIQFCRLNNIVFHHSSRPDAFVAHCPSIFSNPNTILWLERGPLQQALLDLFLSLGGHMEFNSTIIDIEPHIDGTLIAKIASGATCNGSYIVGADGVNSRVRKYLYTLSPPKKAANRCPFMEIAPFRFFNSSVSLARKITGRPQREAWEVSQTPWTALYGITKPLPDHLLTGDEKEDGGAGYMHWYLRDVPGAYSTYSLQGGRVFWICYQQEARRKGESFSRLEAEATMNTYSNVPYCTALPIRPGQDPVEYERYRADRSTYFHEITSRSERIGKVRLTHTAFREISNEAKSIVLIGDAAHAMNTFNGQGAGMGIEEGLVLCIGLLRSAWANMELRGPVDQDMLGIRYFEAQRLARSERVTNLGWWTAVGIMGNWWWLRKLRDVVLARVLAEPTPAKLEKQRKAKIAAVDAPEENCFGRKKKKPAPGNWLFDHQIHLESEAEFWESVRAAAAYKK